MTTDTTSEKKAPIPKRLMIDCLFDFIRKEEEVNSVLSGYFCSLVLNLQQHDKAEFAKYAFNPKNEVVQSMVRHIYNRSISDTLYKMLLVDSVGFE